MGLLHLIAILLTLMGALPLSATNYSKLCASLLEAQNDETERNQRTGKILEELRSGSFFDLDFLSLLGLVPGLRYEGAQYISHFKRNPPNFISHALLAAEDSVGKSFWDSHPDFEALFVEWSSRVMAPEPDSGILKQLSRLQTEELDDPTVAVPGPHALSLTRLFGNRPLGWSQIQAVHVLLVLEGGVVHLMNTYHSKLLAAAEGGDPRAMSNDQRQIALDQARMEIGGLYFVDYPTAQVGPMPDVHQALTRSAVPAMRNDQRLPAHHRGALNFSATLFLDLYPANELPAEWAVYVQTLMSAYKDLRRQE